MGKLSLNRITSNYGFQKSLNAMMEAIEEEFEKVLYRDNPSGSTNTMSNDLDMSEFDLLNVGVVNARSYLVSGGDLSSTIEESIATATAIASSVAEYEESAAASALSAEASATLASNSAAAALVSEGLASDYADSASHSVTEMETLMSTISQGVVLPETILEFSDYDSTGLPGMTIPNGSRLVIGKNTTSASQTGNVQYKNTLNYTGGTAGYVCSNALYETEVSSGVVDYVWGITSVLNNSSNAGENVAIYGQGNRIAGTGPVWGGVMQVQDMTNTSGLGKAQTIGLEIDVFANGASVTGGRVGLDIAFGKAISGGSLCEGDIGIQVGPQNGDYNNASIARGIVTKACVTSDAEFSSTGATYGVNITGSKVVGISLENATCSSAAIRIAAGQKIALEATGTMTIEYDSASASILFKNGSTTKHTFAMV